MEDHIKFTINQIEEDCIRLTAAGQAAVASAASEISVSFQSIDDLIQEIEEFLSQEDMETYWESDIPGLGVTPCIAMNFIPGNQAGSVLLELYLELNDGGDFTRHICRFYIHTSRDLLRNFCTALRGYSKFTSNQVLTLQGL